MSIKAIRELIAITQPEGNIELEWLMLSSAKDRQESISLLENRIYSKFSEGQNTGAWLLELAFSDVRTRLSSSMDFWRNFAGNMEVQLRNLENPESARTESVINLTSSEFRHILDAVPLTQGSEYVTLNLLQKSWNELIQTFRHNLAIFNGTVEEYVQTFNPDIHLAGRVYFHLVENPRDKQPFAFMATYSTGLTESGKSRHVPLKFALQEFSGRRESLLELLSTVYTASERSNLINGLIESGELFHPLSWTADEAYTFLSEVDIYEQSGIICRIPNWWKARSSKLRLTVSLGDKQPPMVGLDAIVSISPSLSIDGVPISKEEIQLLLQENEGLAFLKNRWVQVDKEKLQQTLDAYQKAREMMEKGLSLREAMSLQLNSHGVFSAGDDSVELSNGEWLENVITSLQNPRSLEGVLQDGDFTATLREYQQQGVNWLWFLYRLGFGACLADDMGLGKTIQILAFLNVLKQHEPESSSLLVVPASLLGNWLQEAKRFFPKLRIYGAHPSLNKVIKNPDCSFDLIITTYSLVQRYKWIQENHWTCAILDEAQAIKNPATTQAKAVKRINAGMRISLTGTPVENRLGDLWSQFDFLNRGLLGTSSEFKRFANGLNDNPEGYSRLRQIISPYILRRLKTDKSIIADLPEKVEMKSYAELTKKQVVLYRKLTEDLMELIENSEGIQRRGLVLSYLMKFKQLCNHPDQYSGQDGYAPEDSGKFLRLGQICEIVQQKRERMLVFTQFKEITQALHDYLEVLFGRPGLILHGQVAVGKRKNLVERFQGREYIPFMILSIKAGGVGLNLTNANHVVHFDRWWNPAVENQATDRAFRIGQKRDVLVHKFVTRGTIEERIDDMIEEKKELAEHVVSKSGEKMLTELDNSELIKMLTLKL